MPSRRMMMAYIMSHQSRLPAEFQEVEYLESTGTQYINTGILGSERINVPIVDESVIEFTQVSSGDQYQGFGPRANSHYGITNTGVYTLSGGINSTTNSIGVKRTLKITYTTTTSTLEIGNAETIVRKSSTIGAVSNPYSLLGTDERYYCFAKLYSTKIRIQGTLVRDFVPCYRKADNEPGLYDLVNGVFYTNAGSGTFIVGGNV